MTKHFSPRLKELAVKQFMTGESILYVANFLDTTREKVEAAIRAKLLENEEALKRVAERFIDGVFDGHGNKAADEDAERLRELVATK